MNCMNQDTRHYINQQILKQSANVRFISKAIAPSDERALFSFRKGSELVVWNGACEDTVYQDARVNMAFRALHDATHLETGLGFAPDQEIEMGRIQAARQTSSLMADLMYAEIAGQALYYKQTGLFVKNQALFTESFLKVS
jgi:hypothetical protein